MVTEMLARPYSVTSVVSHGKKLGRTLGFPTANQSIPPLRAVPAFGVYAVRMTVDGNIYHGVANVGVRPTVENTDAVNCETYLLDFEGDLYGEFIIVHFISKIRDIIKFNSLEELKEQIKKDIEFVLLTK